MSNTTTLEPTTTNTEVVEVAEQEIELANLVLVAVPTSSRPAKTANVGRPCACSCDTSIVDTKRKDAKFVSGHDARLKGQVGRLIVGEELTHPVPNWATSNYDEMILVFTERFSKALAGQLAEWVRRHHEKKMAKLERAAAQAEEQAAKVAQLKSA